MRQHNWLCISDWLFDSDWL